MSKKLLFIYFNIIINIKIIGHKHKISILFYFFIFIKYCNKLLK